MEPTASPQLVVRRRHPPLASRRFRLAGQSLRSRQRGDIRQCRRPSSPQSGQTEWCAPPDEPREKTGGGENSAVAWDVPAAARLFPFLSRVRCTIPQDAPASSGTSCPRGHVDTLCNTSEGNPMAFIFFLIVAIKAFVIFAEKKHEIWIRIYHDQQVPQRVIHW